MDKSTSSFEILGDDDSDSRRGRGVSNALPLLKPISKPLVPGLRSFNFLPFYNEVYRMWLATRTASYFQQLDFARWAMTFLIGVVAALVAVLITYLIRKLIDLKLGIVSDLVSRELGGMAPHGVAGVVLVLMSMAYAFFACLPVLLSPIAAGAGIAEIKCLLNGIKIPKAVRISTLIAKIFGVSFSASTGLPVGPEGPMIHCGAIVGAGLSQGKSTTLKFNTDFSKTAAFRNDAEKRDFIVCGAAAGIASAFGAPAGGVLFALEEGATFWFQSLTWRAFFCAVMSTYVFNILLSGFDDGATWGTLTAPGMFTFGDFSGASGNTSTFFVWEIPFFIMMGVLGGGLGAGFVALNRRLMQIVPFKWRRLMEGVLIAGVFAAITFSLPLALSVCQAKPDATHARYAEALVPMYCPNGQYNELATLLLTSPENAVLQLFHFTDINAFSASTLIVFTVTYSSFMVMALGLGMPAGLFIPSILAGAGLGRLIGIALHYSFGGTNVADAGTYALIGAAASLGGISRMTISIAVILLESTGDVQIGLPLMLTLMAARWTGNFFNEGVYDMQINLKHLPLLESEAPPEIRLLRVRDIMSGHPQCISMTPSIAEVVDVLSNSEYSSFPVLYPKEYLEKYPQLGNCAGIMMRVHLCVLLKKRIFEPAPPPIPVHNGPLDKCVNMTDVNPTTLLSYSDLDGMFPRYPEFSSIVLQPEDFDKYLDLRGYMCAAPYTVKEKAPAMHAFELFRGLGTRQLIVLNDFNNVVGVITRQDVLHQSITQRFTTEGH